MSNQTSFSKSKYQVGLIGVGVMGEALISGLISARFPKAQIVFTESVKREPARYQANTEQEP